ncbi:MAG: hypothetical protein ACRDFX_09045 [Chloroflexota bacterium]
MAMTADEQPPTDKNAQLLRESRAAARHLQFFVAAMTAQLREMHDKLEQVEVAATGGEVSERVVGIERERDAARQEIAALTEKLKTSEQHVATLKQDLERQLVTFADHHAAKQEIARLRAELEQQREVEEEQGDKSGQRKRWLGRA